MSFSYISKLFLGWKHYRQVFLLHKWGWKNKTQWKHNFIVQVCNGIMFSLLLVQRKQGKNDFVVQRTTKSYLRCVNFFTHVCAIEIRFRCCNAQQRNHISVVSSSFLLNKSVLLLYTLLLSFSFPSPSPIDANRSWGRWV